MARYDVYRQKRGGCLVLDCQADLLSDLNTRFVVPLLPMAEAPRPAVRLNPVFGIEGEQLVMVTQFAATMAVRELGDRLVSLAPEQDAIAAALDMLISGF